MPLPHVLFDARSTSTLRITGWERYTRNLLGVVAPLANVAVSSTDVRGVAGRLASDWIGIPRHSRGFDVTHFPSFPPSAFVQPKRAMITIHDLTWWKYPATSSTAGRHYYRRLAEHSASAAMIVTVSETVKDELLERFPHASVVVIGNIVAIDAVLPEAYALPNRPYLLAVGSIEPRKNLQRLAEAFGRSGLADDFDLLLVGRQAWGNVPRGVKFTGPVSDAQLSTIYSSAKALVAPSLYEGFGLPIAEAISLGVPVYCSDIPVFREVARDLGNYFIPTEIESIVESLRRAAARADSKRPAAQNRFTADACRDQVLRAYRAFDEQR